MVLIMPNNAKLVQLSSKVADKLILNMQRSVERIQLSSFEDKDNFLDDHNLG
jgi:hypothetical protein